MRRCVFQFPHLAELVILERLSELRPAVHDERAMTHHRFVDRLTGHEQQPGFHPGRHFDPMTRSIEDCEVAFDGGFPAVDRHLALDHQEQGGVTVSNPLWGCAPTPRFSAPGGNG
jgi:hypothetical protein